MQNKNKCYNYIQYKTSINICNSTKGKTGMWVHTSYKCTLYSHLCMYCIYTILGNRKILTVPNPCSLQLSLTYEQTCLCPMSSILVEEVEVKPKHNHKFREDMLFISLGWGEIFTAVVFVTDMWLQSLVFNDGPGPHFISGCPGKTCCVYLGALLHYFKL